MYVCRTVRILTELGNMQLAMWCVCQLVQGIYVIDLLFFDQYATLVKGLHVELPNNSFLFPYSIVSIILVFPQQSCLLFSMCNAYAEIGLLIHMYHVCSLCLVATDLHRNCCKCYIWVCIYCWNLCWSWLFCQWVVDIYCLWQVGHIALQRVFEEISYFFSYFTLCFVMYVNFLHL